MAAMPIADDVFLVSRAAVDAKALVPAGLDRGCSLTKAVYVPRDGTGCTDTYYALHCAVFPNSQFTGCLEFLRDNARLPQPGAAGRIRVTGAGCQNNRAEIEAVLGLPVEFVQEMPAMWQGANFLIEHTADRETLFYPRTGAQEEDSGPEASKGHEETRRLDFSGRCVHANLGSGAGVWLVEPDGSVKILGCSFTGGRTLMALGSALADTDTSYDQLMALAEHGNASKIDAAAGDSTEVTSSRESPERPLLSFGQLSLSGGTLAEFSREDRAAATVRHFAQIYASLLRCVCGAVGVNGAIVGGHSINHVAMRRAIEAWSQQSRPGRSRLDLRFLKTGATGAVGAMVGAS